MDLDKRQRAMLEEMGIRVYWPETPEAEPEPEHVAPPVARAAPAPAPVAQQRPVPATAPAPMRTPGPAGAGLFGAGDAQPDYLLLLDPATEDEERQGQPVLGDAGKLLDNMLAALGVSRKRSVYLACVPRSGLEGVDELLRQQVEQLRPRVILAMGRFAVQGLLRSGEPPGRLRGRAHDFAGVPVVVTYHPAYLLRNQADKANAWADLCLARSLLD
ncbi:uracil-DNA glycosylase [Ramlibacter sp. XY19]|nr:uracil-DNA glycosylase [Ramlibacter paludis]MCG2594819.1 uracil-DNA glycosylase [Ramlibacter paludis]